MVLTLPIQIGKKYVRRDGQVVEVVDQRAGKLISISNAARGDREVYTSTGRAFELDRAHPIDLVADYVEPTKGHPHAGLMMQYAMDAAETDKPWERWEFDKTVRGELAWAPCVDHPRWYTKNQYRRKPLTVSVGDHEVTQPVRDRPALGDTLYMPNLVSPRPDNVLVSRLVWSDSHYDNWLLRRGLLHATQRAAHEHAVALLSFTEGAGG